MIAPQRAPGGVAAVSRRFLMGQTLLRPKERRKSDAGKRAGFRLAILERGNVRDEGHRRGLHRNNNVDLCRVNISDCMCRPVISRGQPPYPDLR